MSEYDSVRGLQVQSVARAVQYLSKPRPMGIVQMRPNLILQGMERLRQLVGTDPTLKIIASYDDTEAIARDALRGIGIDLDEHLYQDPPPSLPHDPDTAEAGRREDWEIEQYQRQWREAMEREWKRQGVW